MPEICRFYGIVIKMYFADHAPPHFHAEYAEQEVRIAIDSLAVISGRLPPRAHSHRTSCGANCLGIAPPGRRLTWKWSCRAAAPDIGALASASNRAPRLAAHFRAVRHTPARVI